MNVQSCETELSPSLADYRQGMKRFAGINSRLPLDTEATCPVCSKVTESTFNRKGQQIVLEYHCATCGENVEVHHDAIWTSLVSDVPGSPLQTYHGSRIHPVIRSLPRTVESLCPQCVSIIVGRYFVQNNVVYMEKTCPEHGYFRDKISPDPLLFTKASWWSFQEHAGQKHPQVTGAESCPSDCGLCNQHLSSPCLAQVDVTNRCNMNCPICFASANTRGEIFELGYDEIISRMQVLRDLRPHPCTAIQFTGGEPTIHPDFLKIVRAAGEMGFTHIQIATNGIKLSDPAYARECVDAGLHTLYLQFDGIGEEPYRESRNYPGIWEIKKAVVENARQTGLKICLVPTIVRGVNDDQILPILQFAFDNVDVISGISWQPVSFTGRMSFDQLEKHRYTLGDLASDLGKYEGVEPLRDMFPLSIVVPLSNLLEAFTGQPKIRASAHPGCAFGTYFLVSPQGKVCTFPSIIDVEGMFCEMNSLADRIKARGSGATWLDKIRLFRILKRNWRKDTAPSDLTLKRFYRTIMGMVDKSVGRGRSGDLNYRTLLCAGMHFQDRYNFDVERAKRCVILYSTPAGVFPFCTHNCGPEYRYLTVESQKEKGDK